MKGCRVIPPGIRRAEVRENDECLVMMVWNKMNVGLFLYGKMCVLNVKKWTGRLLALYLV